MRCACQQRLLVASRVVVCVFGSRPPTLKHTHTLSHTQTGRDTQYFVMTVFSTVGFGDVTPDNSAERGMCVVLMLGSILIFGNLLAEVPSISCLYSSLSCPVHPSPLLPRRMQDLIVL